MSKLDQSFTSASSSHSKVPHIALIKKIIALQDALYQANLQNQELQLKKIRLQCEFQTKKTQLFGQPITLQPVCQKRLSRNNSQPSTNRKYFTNPVSGSITPGLMSVQPAKGCLIRGNESSFQALKLQESQDNCCQSKLSGFSSPRTLGIRRNVKKVAKQQDKQLVNLQFKTIEQIWNGVKTESFLKKTSERPAHIKKISYLT